MKAIVNKQESSAVRSTPVIALKHPSYRRPVMQAAAALRHLSEQYRVKNSTRTTGHA